MSCVSSSARDPRHSVGQDRDSGVDWPSTCHAQAFGWLANFHSGIWITFIPLIIEFSVGYLDNFDSIFPLESTNELSSPQIWFARIRDELWIRFSTLTSSLHGRRMNSDSLRPPFSAWRWTSHCHSLMQRLIFLLTFRHLYEISSFQLTSSAKLVLAYPNLGLGED